MLDSDRKVLAYLTEFPSDLFHRKQIEESLE